MNDVRIRKFLMFYNQGDRFLMYQAHDKGLTTEDIEYMEHRGVIAPTGIEEQFIVLVKNQI